MTTVPRAIALSELSKFRNGGDRMVPTFRLMLKELAIDVSSLRTSMDSIRESSVWVRCWNSHRFEARSNSGSTDCCRSAIEMYSSRNTGCGFMLPGVMAQIGWRRIRLDRSARRRKFSSLPSCSGSSALREPLERCWPFSLATASRALRSRSRCMDFTRSSSSSYWLSTLYQVQNRARSSSSSPWLSGSSLNR